ncbi:unnamed protein product, partial [Brenthis ino]
MLKLSILYALSIALCCATPSCHELHQSQLASLNDRMTQMINSLYTSPISAKTQPPSTPQSSSNATPSDYTYDTSYYHYPYVAPQVIYVSPPMPYLPPTPNIPLAPTKAPSYYPHIPEYPELPKPTWSHYYDQYPSPPATYPSAPVPYPSSPQLAPPASPYPPPPSPYLPSPIPTPYPHYSYSWDNYPEYPKPVYPPPPPVYPPVPSYPSFYPRQPDMPPYYV